MKKTLLFLGILGVSFLFSNNVKAETLQQLNYNTEFDGGSTSLSTFPQYFINPPSSNTTEITSIKIRFKPDNACDWKLKLWNTSLQTVNSNNLTLSAGEQFAEFTWTANSNFRLDNLSRFSLDAGTTFCGVGAYTGSIYGINTTSTYPNGYFYDGNQTMKNAYFAINGEQAEISFTDTPTSTCNFQNWALTSNISSDIYNTLYNGSYVVGFNNSVTGDSIGGYFFYDTGSPLGIGNQNFYIPHTGSFQENSVYYARAFICDSNNIENCNPELTNEHLVAQSDEYEFVINAFDSCSSTSFSQGEARPPELLNDTFAQLTDQAYTNCENMDNVVTRGLCKALVFLFVPNNTVLNNFIELKDTINTKPPFGYVSIYASTTASLTTSTATTTVDFSDIENFTFLEKVNTLLIWILYFVFGIWVIKRFSKLQL